MNGVIAMVARMTWEEIKNAYPEQFVYLKDVERPPGNSASVKSAVVVYAAPTTSSEHLRMCFNGDLVEKYTAPDTTLLVGALGE